MNDICPSTETMKRIGKELYLYYQLQYRKMLHLLENSILHSGIDKNSDHQENDSVK